MVSSLRLWLDETVCDEGWRATRGTTTHLNRKRHSNYGNALPTQLRPHHLLSFFFRPKSVAARFATYTEFFVGIIFLEFPSSSFYRHR
jgi:hypothetical protein